MSMKWSVLSAAVLVALLAAGSGAGSSSTPITACGQIVTENAVLTTDLGPCPGSGIVVGASGITIDLRGHVVRGDGSSLHYGIDDFTFARSNVKIQNGVVRGFEYGVRGFQTSNVALSNLVIAGNTVVGIGIFGDSASIRSVNASGNGESGIVVAGDATRIQSSTASGNLLVGFEVDGLGTKIQSSSASGNGGDGVEAGGDSATVQSSTATGNGARGIWVGGEAAHLRGNHADANGFGGGSDGDGLGIEVDSTTTGPVGTNVARGNDDPAECSPASIC